MEMEAPGQDAIRELLNRAVHEKVANELSGIYSKIKQLSALAHHELGTPLKYSRAEAQFVVRLSEAFLALLGRLSSKS